MSAYRTVGKRSCAFAFVLSILLSLCPVFAVGESPLPEAEYEGYIVEAAPKRPRFLLQSVPDTPQADLSQLEGVENLNATEGLYLVDDDDALARLAQKADLVSVEPNYVYTLPDEEMIPLSVTAGTGAVSKRNLPHLKLIKALRESEEAAGTWVTVDTRDGSDQDLIRDMNHQGTGLDPAVIGVLDTGLFVGHQDIDYTHILWPDDGFQTDLPIKGDGRGHGTFIIGQILACVDSLGGASVGIDGLIPEAYVMPLRIYDSSGKTNDARILNAMNYAISQRMAYLGGDPDAANVCVLNLSFGGKTSSKSLKTSIENAIKAGIIVVCAAGNSGDSNVSGTATDATYPAQYGIGVGSTTSSGAATAYSQVLSSANGIGFQNKVWVSAPGDAYSSLGLSKSAYSSGSGTSFAAPIVSSLAAVALNLNNDLVSYYTYSQNGTSKVDPVTAEGSSATIKTNHAAFKQLLYQTSKQMNSGTNINGQDIHYGWGIVDFEAVETFLTTSAVKFLFRDMDGAPLSIAPAVQVFLRDTDGAWTEDDLLTPETHGEFGEGVYTMERGKSYHYQITADGLDTPVEGDLTMDWFSRYHEVTLRLDISSRQAYIAQVVPPTCTEIGYTSYHSLVDGTSYTDSTSTLKKLGHSAGMEQNWGAPTPATCTTAGSQVKVVNCTRCGAELSRKTVTTDAALGHDYIDTVTEPTCTEGGYTTHTCSRCDDTYTDSPVNALGHNYNAVITNPTCTEPGYTTHTCSRCDHTYTDSETSALGHEYGPVIYTWSGNYSSATARMVCARDEAHVLSETVSTTSVTTKEATESEEGLVTYTAHFSNVVVADLTKNVVTPVLTHVHVPAEPTRENEVSPTCTQPGSYDSVVYCSGCGEELSRTPTEGESALGHDYVSNTTAPTCTQEGFTVHVCFRCNDTYTDSRIPALEHDYNSVVTAPTCLESGYTTHTCSRCDHTYTDSPVNALGHDHHAVVTHPTCTEPGYTTHSCSRCGDTYTDNETGALGHLYGSATYTWALDNSSVSAERVCQRPECGHEATETVSTVSKVTREATESEDGVMVYTATFEMGNLFDAQTKEVGIPKLTHTHVPSASVRENVILPSCTAPGSYDMVTYCSNCGKELTREYIVGEPALGHSYTTEVILPTCTEIGRTIHTCSRCDDSYSDSDTPALGHDYVATVTPPTCEEPGFTTHACSRCNDSYTDTPVEALGHDYGEATYTWSKNNSSVTAKRVCTRNAAHVITVTVSTTSKITTAATKTTPGTKVYTATFKGNSLFDSQSKEVVIPATGSGNTGGGSTGGGSGGGSAGGGTTPAVEKFTVIYKLRGLGTTKDATTETLSRGSKPKSVPSVTGLNSREFLGWSETDPDTVQDPSTIKLVDPKTYTITKDKTFYAIYKEPIPKAEPAQTEPPETAPIQTEPLSPEDERKRLIQLASDAYSDIRQDAWYANAVGYVTDRNLFQGTGKGRFEPEIHMTQAMAMTVLYRLAGEPLGSWSQVESGRAWYTVPVAWAEAQGLTRHLDVSKVENTPVTREDLATMLFRLAEQMGWDVSVRADLSGFMDTDYISSYATEAMSWANATGLIQGMDWNGLDPQGRATRCQVAAIFMRFCEKLDTM